MGMIIGLGSDLIDITRVERTLERFGDRFTQRCFTEIERAKSDRRANRADSYAKRYAAKEACSKALGTGFRRGVFWRDMGVVNLPSGKPSSSSPLCRIRLADSAQFVAFPTRDWCKPGQATRNATDRRRGIGSDEPVWRIESGR